MLQWPDLESLGVRVLALPPRQHARFPVGGIVLSGVTTPPEGFRRLSADALIRPGLRFTLGELRQWLRLAPETAVALRPFDRLAHTWQPPARRLRRRIVDVGEKVGGRARTARAVVGPPKPNLRSRDARPWSRCGRGRRWRSGVPPACARRWLPP